ncbi:MAG: ATP-dependent zinc metalloprotease FtsH [Vicinamibacteria bacterium]|nr:ATP-dependent zinc metalloprotease FtsH [Vicinamibacteria bacterium]
MHPHRKRQFQITGGYWLLAFAALLLLQTAFLREAAPRDVPYSEFLASLRGGKVARAEVREDSILVELKAAGGAKPARLRTSRLPGMDETALLKELEAQSVSFSGRIERTSFLESFLIGWLLPLVILAAIYVLVMRRLSPGTGGPLNLGRNRAKIYDETRHGKVTFADVAGVDEAEAELVEVVDFLRNPQKYLALGARIPRGVLLVGPPGTGKTLLAKAVAGEAGVPFFSLSGSEFVEMFVGLGAARMRDLFEQAKLRAPCIVFIDELDAIGKSRGGMAAFATHDEREQTLNQLLVEIDGFDSTKGVILMGATNRPEVLDPALLRAGRFDRQVLVDRPEVRGREAILSVHGKKLKLAPDVDLQVVARRTPGMVGADLERVVNEAALAAARRGSLTVSGHDFEEAVDRLQLGLKKQGSVMSEDEKRRVAFHEGGHTLVALSVKHADPVHRVTIIPRTIGALGVTLQLPAEERYLMTREQLLDRLAVMMGGRAAEELCCGDLSTGAANDLERATETARQMVSRFGMSATLGPVTFGRVSGPRFLAGTGGEERNFSEDTARAIDAEVRGILEREYARARRILEERRDALEAIARRLLDVETLDRSQLEELTGPGASRSAHPAARPSPIAFSDAR